MTKFNEKNQYSLLIIYEDGRATQYIKAPIIGKLKLFLERSGPLEHLKNLLNKR